MGDRHGDDVEDEAANQDTIDTWKRLINNSGEAGLASKEAYYSPLPRLGWHPTITAEQERLPTVGATTGLASLNHCFLRGEFRAE